MSTFGVASFAVETVSRVWNVKPYQNVRIPDFQRGKAPVVADALWTDYELRPSANNLAFLVQSVSSPSEFNIWSKRLNQWPIRGGLLISPDGIQLFYPLGVSGELVSTVVERDLLATELQNSKSHLFSPKKLAQYRTGQLSLADLEDSITRNSFSFLEQQRSQLDKAFKDAIEASLQVVRRVQTGHSKELEGHVIRVSIAYLAARILEDKHFFESDIPTNDVRQLLRATVSKTNGFFKRAFDQSIPSLEEFAPDCADEVLQQLSVHLGDRVSFSLIDHRDVGRLYERAIKELPKFQDLPGQDWTDLQRHYTPVAITERMLEMLPLERLRPEERVIFDPAAGSGSFLLAATSRLAGMSDLPDNRSQYLSSHVIGNDIDQYANLVTNLRYILASESLGKDAIFPAPDDFYCSDYNLLDINLLQRKPKVLVANPPFSEDGNKQMAVEFVRKALNWMDEGSQFAFVMPQTFLKGTTHGFDEVRHLMSEQCQIFEVCQLPAGNVGVQASQDVCLFAGSLGNSSKTFTLSRGIFSQVRLSEVREFGFLGKSWISSLDQDVGAWKSTTAPSIKISVPTIPLANLFFIFNGVTPSKNHKPVANCPPGIQCRLNWRMKWRDPKRIWANHNLVDQNEKWIKYGDEFLHRAVTNFSNLFSMSKILVGRKVNRGSINPLGAHLDTIGLCPDNDIFCIIPSDQACKYNRGFSSPNQTPDAWFDLDFEAQTFWLLGILASNLGNTISLIGRGTREITSSELCNFPLPMKVDLKIAEVVKKIIGRDQMGEEIPEVDELYQALNQLIEQSYGNPNWIEIQRTGIPPELKE